ncbi:ABC transporter ATP-binding protein [Cellulosilyticum sp. I15G10I2]|uniref:ABC transporter ATP-binding protein n=1 Tax=Cellulosilyticum sp. I15G10I2 TaxID=1892843 RepID=UPI00085C202F|nr:ABC transporter ATP-binding protein [Cellulosilyticum sp. I15G10I2]
MIMQAKDVYVSFKKENQKRLWGKERQQVLKGVHLILKEGECLGIIGESGSGKSTFGKVLLGLLKPDQGEVTLDGMPLYGRSYQSGSPGCDHKISVVFQDYTSSVNPRFRVKDIIGESLRFIMKTSKTKFKKEEHVEELLRQVGLDSSFKDRYPHELSGGELQRVCIARAIAVRPKVILLDEAISSLDVSTQTQIMDLLIELRAKYSFSYIFITHDLTAITYLCDRVMFFHEGQIVEQVDDISRLSSLKNKYARKLLRAVMPIDIKPEWESKVI